MDKEILRIVIIATGLIIVVAMLIWGYLKDKELQYGLDFGDTETDEVEDLQPLKPTTPDKVITVSDDDYDNEDEYIAPIGSAANNYYSIDEDDEEEEEYTPAPPRVTTPSIIQFCLVAKAEEGFNGLDLMRGFRIAGLKYGLHRLR